MAPFLGPYPRGYELVGNVRKGDGLRSASRNGSESDAENRRDWSWCLSVRPLYYEGKMHLPRQNGKLS